MTTELHAILDAVAEGLDVFEIATSYAGSTKHLDALWQWERELNRLWFETNAPTIGKGDL